MSKHQEQVEEIGEIIKNLTKEQVLNATVKGLGIAEELPKSYDKTEIVTSKDDVSFQVAKRNDEDHAKRVSRLREQSM